MTTTRQHGEATAYQAPPQGNGYYDRDRTHWWDSHVGHFLPVTEASDRLVVHAQEVADDSWLGRALPRLARLVRAPRYRFVGVAASDDPRWRSYRIVGDEFTTGRLRWMGGSLAARSYAPRPLAALTEFSAHLFERGWLPESRGKQWWSRELSRPCVQWPAATVSATVRIDARAIPRIEFPRIQPVRTAA
jgi:hypothetical protein